MKNVARSLALVVGVGLVLTAVGCRKCIRPEEPIPPPPLPETMPEIIGDIGDPGAGAGLELATIYFDFDLSGIRPDDAKKLEDNARRLKEAAAVGQEPTVSVEGHCDPMGTAAYNMALGMRRAEAAKAFLARLGVPAARLSTVSFGKEQLVTSDPDQFALNRRVEFKIQ